MKNLKRIEQKPGHVVLRPANASMEAMAYLPEEVQVQGSCVSYYEAMGRGEPCSTLCQNCTPAEQMK